MTFEDLVNEFIKFDGMTRAEAINAAHEHADNVGGC